MKSFKMLQKDINGSKKKWCSWLLEIILPFDSTFNNISWLVLCPHCIRKSEWFLSSWIGRLFSWMLRRISLGFGNASPSLPRSLGEPVPKRKENYVTIPWKDCNECFNFLIFGMNRFCRYKSSLVKLDYDYDSEVSWCFVL